MNTQSTGTVTLTSNPSAAPSIDPNFLSHPFDRRLAIDSVRGALEFLDLECLKKDEVRLATGPTGRGDEEILVCHFALICKKGKAKLSNVPGLRASQRGQHVASVRHVQDGSFVRAFNVRRVGF